MFTVTQTYRKVIHIWGAKTFVLTSRTVLKSQECVMGVSPPTFLVHVVQKPLSAWWLKFL